MGPGRRDEDQHICAFHETNTKSISSLSGAIKTLFWALGIVAPILAGCIGYAAVKSGDANRAVAAHAEVAKMQAENTARNIVALENFCKEISTNIEEHALKIRELEVRTNTR